jgi:hypothetical protein
MQVYSAPGGLFVPSMLAGLGSTFYVWAQYYTPYLKKLFHVYSLPALMAFTAIPDLSFVTMQASLTTVPGILSGASSRLISQPSVVIPVAPLLAHEASVQGSFVTEGITGTSSRLSLGYGEQPVITASETLALPTVQDVPFLALTWSMPSLVAPTTLSPIMALKDLPALTPMEPMTPATQMPMEAFSEQAPSAFLSAAPQAAAPEDVAPQLATAQMLEAPILHVEQLMTVSPLTLGTTPAPQMPQEIYPLVTAQMLEVPAGPTLETVVHINDPVLENTSQRQMAQWSITNQDIWIAAVQHAKQSNGRHQNTPPALWLYSSINKEARRDMFFNDFLKNVDWKALGYQSGLYGSPCKLTPPPELRDRYDLPESMNLSALEDAVAVGVHNHIIGENEDFLRFIP